MKERQRALFPEYVVFLLSESLHRRNEDFGGKSGQRRVSHHLMSGLVFETGQKVSQKINRHCSQFTDFSGKGENVR